jgi:hypothetical protein
MMLRMQREKRASFPSVLELDRAVLDKIGQVVAASVTDNVIRQRTVDGGRIKLNAPSTRERKRREGKPALSLIDEQRRFIKPGAWTWRVKRNSVTILPSTSELRELMRELQERGYVGWFGASPKALAAVREIVKAYIMRRFEEAKKRREGGKR